MAYLTEKQAAEVLQVSQGIVNKLVKSGRLKAVRLTGMGNVRIKEEDLYDIADAPPSKRRVARKKPVEALATLAGKRLAGKKKDPAPVE